MKKISLFLIASLLVVLSSMAPAAARGSRDDSQPPPPPPTEINPDMAPAGPAADSAIAMSYHAGTGKVRFIGTAAGQPLARAATLAAGATPEEAARSFLADHGYLFGLQAPAEELQVVRVRSAEGGRSAVRFQQVYQGIPVVAGELIVQTDSSGNVLAASGEVLPDLALDTTPAISAEEARQRALEIVTKEYDIDASRLVASEPELWIYNPVLLGAPGMPTSTLVWRMRVTPLDLLPFDEFVLVDAQRGFVTLHFNQIDTSRYRLIYDNNNNPAYGLPGNGPVRSEGEGPGSVADVNNAYDYAGDTYDFYASRHGRDSIDDAGMVLVHTVRYCPNSTSCPYANAFWNGEQMVYGEGYASADDVVAHEMTHGVTQHESNLFYYMQSGAINESFSDVWGEFVDLVNGRGNDDAGVRWLLGEDLPIGAIRSMSNPPAYNDPDRMGSSYYYCGTGDNGGVHTNSGVGNKAAYLMVDGGTFNGYTVTGIGIDKTARIWYEAQTQLLTSGADYQDLHDALSQACNNLTGTAGITAADCVQVRRAIAATEMNRQPSSCAAPHAPVCDEYGFNHQFNGTIQDWLSCWGSWYVDSNYLFTEGSPAESSSVVMTEIFGDLDYTVRMRRYGCDTCANRIMIRGVPLPLDSSQRWYSYYSFQYTRSGYFSVFGRADGGSPVTLQDWTLSPAINTGDAWNTLRVVANGSRISFYINDALVWAGTHYALAHGHVGIGMYRDSGSTGNKLEVDWATLSGGTPIDLFYDSLENGPDRWVSGANVGSNQWYYTAGYATSGNYMLYGYDQPAVADFFVRMASGTALPSGRTAYLHFNHAHDFESAFDGGVLEYSANGGAWTDAGSLITHNGYNGILSTCCSNPLGGRSAFVAESYGYYSTRLNLGQLAGNSVRFRYRIGTDSSVDNLGWIIDDVRIYICARQAWRTYLPLATKGHAPTPGFNSQFNGSAEGWEVHTGAWTVDSNYYSTPGLRDLSSSASYVGEFSNMDYRVRMRRYGCNTCANRILIRGVPDPLDETNRWYSYYAFQYSGDRYYSVWKRVGGGSPAALQGWTYSPAINSGEAWNTLRVVANGSSISFYINGTLVWSGTDTSLSSGRVGIGMYDDASTGNLLQVDWATLTIPGLSAMSVPSPLPTATLAVDGATGGDENCHESAPLSAPPQ